MSAIARAPSRPSRIAASTSVRPSTSVASNKDLPSTSGRADSTRVICSAPPYCSRCSATIDLIRAPSLGSSSRSTKPILCSGLPGPLCTPYHEASSIRPRPSVGIVVPSAPATISRRSPGRASRKRRRLGSREGRAANSAYSSRRAASGTASRAASSLLALSLAPVIGSRAFSGIRSTSPAAKGY